MWTNLIDKSIYIFIDLSLQILKSKGYTKLLIQIGRCEFEPSTDCSVAGFDVEVYRYKPSIEDDISHASLVISHAGIVHY